MLATALSAVLLGLDGHPVTVEVHAGNGLPGLRVVGLPDASCREARDRVRAAVLSSGYRWPQRHITVNLAPGDLRKVGAGLDLAIAMGVLCADGQVPVNVLDEVTLFGELGLDGTVRRVPGALPLVASAVTETVVVPMANAHEARLARADVRAVHNLGQVIGALSHKVPWPMIPPRAVPETPSVPDLAEIRGQAYGRKALEIAAAGGHHLLLVGAAGAGKTMLAVRLPGLLPDLSTEEALEVAKIHSAAGLPLKPDTLDLRPPLRSPHHSATAVSLIGGGGGRVRPGEISCAHHGVLFLDELAEFPAQVLDNLRQPLEEGRVVVSRARSSHEFPARFVLVAAMNACHCGSDGAPGSCRCADGARARYVNRVSGPLLDRFDLRVRVRRPGVDELLAADVGAPEALAANEPTVVVAERARRARERARQRGVSSNALVPSWDLAKIAPLSRAARLLLERRLREGRLSARGLDRVRRVALTISDLDGADVPLTEESVLVALALRSHGLLGQEDDSLAGTTSSQVLVGAPGKGLYR